MGRVAYSACELARAAGYAIRAVPAGGLTVRMVDGCAPLLEVGPHATVEDIVALAAEELDLTDVRITREIGLFTHHCAAAE